jgi:KDO2-lipid IV(A) lauroyltransferase
MDRFINEYRTMAGMHVTYKTGVREMITMLGKGMIIGLLMDQDAGSNGIFVNFFGRLASTPQGSAALARLKNAPIVPAFITENSDGTHTAILHPIRWVDKTEDRDQDIWRTTNELTQIIENHIRKYPHEWFWLHDRWKTRPKQE